MEESMVGGLLDAVFLFVFLKLLVAFLIIVLLLWLTRWVFRIQAREALLRAILAELQNIRMDLATHENDAVRR